MNETVEASVSKEIQTDIFLRFTIVAEVFEYFVKYTIYDVEGWTEENTPLWHKRGSTNYPDTVSKLEDAEIYLHGTVKWDGCSDWYFDEQDKGYIHGCSCRDLQRLGEVMANSWRWTAKLCSRWDGY